MTDSDLQRRINRQFDVDDIKGKAVLWIAVLILVAYVVSR